MSGAQRKMSSTSALVLFGLAGWACDNAAASGPGDPLPHVGQSGSRPALVWTFDAVDCLGCELTEPSRVIRHLQSRFGEEVEVVVLALSSETEKDQPTVAGFLRSQRVAAKIRIVSQREYTKAFGGSATVPSLYVADQKGVIRDVVYGHRALDLEQLNGVMEQLVEEDYQ